MLTVEPSGAAYLAKGIPFIAAILLLVYFAGRAGYFKIGASKPRNFISSLLVV
jgi:hypothetical protein